MTTYRSRAADQRIAEDVGVQQDLMCSAQGCPHRWSVDAGSGKLCSWHAWAEPHRWPQITQERVDAMAERAYRAQYKQPPEPVRSMSKAEKLGVLQRLRDAVASLKTGRTDWARKIVAREKAGERVGYFALKIAREVVARKDRKEAA